MTENCPELNSIRYKTMLIQGEITPKTDTILNIEELLEQESILNKLEPWCKLDKTLKLKKLEIYANLISKKHNLIMTELNELNSILRVALERKNLNKVKDVIYDKETGVIKNIPMLHFNNITRKFILKKNDKHISTIKSLSIKKPKGTFEQNLEKNLHKDLEKLNITSKIDL